MSRFSEICRVTSANYDSSVTKLETQTRVSRLIDAFGLTMQRNTLIGTPLQKGLSGGQKRRVSVATQLITGPRILYLDEPTSGLDSTASYEVMSFIRDIARSNNLIVIASIHQPSTKTFDLFSKVMLLSQGKTCYYGFTSEVSQYFRNLAMPIPNLTNPAEHMLDLTNADFGDADAPERLGRIFEGWQTSERANDVEQDLKALSGQRIHVGGPFKGPSFLSQVTTLLHRSFVKSYRDIVTYWIRVAMYMGLAIMMGTVWLRLSPQQDHIQPFVNAIVSSSDMLPFLLSLTCNTVLRLSVHELHGCCVRPSIPRGPLNFRQGARQRPLWTHGVPGFQLPHRSSISL